jgi:rhodanese-related sulfurtransferase
MLITIFTMVAALSAQAPAEKPALTINSPELRIGIDEFKKLYEQQDVVVIDVRSAEVYREGHIPGAISVPLDSIDGKLAELKNERRSIVTYCS